MIVTEPTLSTQEAAKVLDVHPSTIKRWCDGGSLACGKTQGGHRRIRLEALLAYARREGESSSLLDFTPDEALVWKGAERLQNGEDAQELIAQSNEWLINGRERMLALLLPFLAEMGTSYAGICDAYLAPLMHNLGNQWKDGNVVIGDVCRLAHGIEAALHYLRHARVRPPKVEPPAQNGSRRTAVVGGLRGERHELGSLMVRLVLEAEGWHVIYLGSDVPTEEFVFQQVKHRASLVGLSLLPPRSARDARDVMTVLENMYDPSCPYRLAFGGSGVAPSEHVFEKSRPFVEVRQFVHLEPFVEWTAVVNGNKV